MGVKDQITLVDYRCPQKHIKPSWIKYLVHHYHCPQEHVKPRSSKCSAFHYQCPQGHVKPSSSKCLVHYAWQRGRSWDSCGLFVTWRYTPALILRYGRGGFCCCMDAVAATCCVVLPWYWSSIILVAGSESAGAVAKVLCGRAGSLRTEHGSWSCCWTCTRVPPRSSVTKCRWDSKSGIVTPVQRCVIQWDRWKVVMHKSIPRGSTTKCSYSNMLFSETGEKQQHIQEHPLSFCIHGLFTFIFSKSSLFFTEMAVAFHYHTCCQAVPFQLCLLTGPTSPNEPLCFNVRLDVSI